MRNLFLFLWKNNILILFISLEVVSFYLIIKNNKFQNTGFFNSSNVVIGNIYTIYNNATNYLHLAKENDLLVTENAKLLSYTSESIFVDTLIEKHIKDSVYKQKYSYIDAKVINNTITKRNNYFTLNKGSRHGIEPDMAVIAPNGVVGIVKDVSENFCAVMSLLNKNAKISSKHRKSGYFGILSWEGESPLQASLNDIPKNAVLTVGDTIITSESSLFPEGIMVGTIKEFSLKDAANFYNIDINLSAQFGKLSYVYVVRNLMKKEQLELEKRSFKNEN